MPLEEEAQIEKGFAEKSPFLEAEGDKEPPNSTIAVQIGMDRLELSVDESRPDKGWESIFRIEVLLQAS